MLVPTGTTLTVAAPTGAILPVGTAALPSSNGVAFYGLGSGTEGLGYYLGDGLALPPVPDPAPAPVEPAPVIPAGPMEQANFCTDLEKATPAGTLAEIGSAAVIETADGIGWRGWGENAPRTADLALLGTALAGWWGVFPKEPKGRSSRGVKSRDDNEE